MSGGGGSHFESGSKENKYEEINMRAGEWVGERKTGVTRAETRFQY